MPCDQFVRRQYPKAFSEPEVRVSDFQSLRYLREPGMKSNSRKNHCAVAERTAEDGRLTLETVQRTIGHTSGCMARLSKAPVLILTAPDAITPPITMTVWTAAAQRERRRNRRYGGGKNNNSK